MWPSPCHHHMSHHMSPHRTSPPSKPWPTSHCASQRKLLGECVGHKHIKAPSTPFSAQQALKGMCLSQYKTPLRQPAAAQGTLHCPAWFPQDCNGLPSSGLGELARMIMTAAACSISAEFGTRQDHHLDAARMPPGSQGCSGACGGPC